MSGEAEKLWKNVLAAYAACDSYRDQGVVTTTFFTDGRRRTGRRHFSTCFVRGEGFLFEYLERRGEDDWDQYAIWTEGDLAHSWSSKLGGRQYEPLEIPIARATGVSGGSSSRVALLLLPELRSRRGSGRSPDTASPEGQAPVRLAGLVESADAAEQNCAVIEWERRWGGSEHLWIDHAHLLIRRVVNPRHQLRGISRDDIEELRGRNPRLAQRLDERSSEQTNEPRTEVESTTTYDASFNVPIDPSELAYTPPGAAT